MQLRDGSGSGRGGAGAEERGKCGKEVRHQAALFYADNGMVDLSYPCWIQGAFKTLFVLFDRVGLRTNVGKTVVMVYRPYQAAGNQSKSSYGRRITREGPTYRELQKGRFSCRGCGEDMAAGSMASHLMTQHRRVSEARRSWRTPAAGDRARTFRMDFPAK